MPELKKTIKYLKCSRCGHEWIPKGKDNPLVCSKCKSPYWNREKKQ